MRRLARAIIARWYTPGVLKPKLAARILEIEPSPTLAFTARAMALRAEGKDIISFAAGEPDFCTPEPICNAAIAAMQSGFTKYTAGRGIAELRDLVAQKLRLENGIGVSGADVIITCGAKHALFNALSAILEPGDEVIIVTPFWTTYRDQVKALAGIPRFAETSREDGFVPRIEAIAAEASPKTKAIMICSPNNPSGAVWPVETLREIGDFAARNNIWILSDEVYEKLIYEGEHVSVAALNPEYAERTITIGSLSKTFAMPGWRIGYMAGPKEAIDAMACVQDQISHPNSFAMKGAVAAMQMSESDVAAMREEFRERRAIMHRRVNEIPGVTADLPPGAFYVFTDFSAYCIGTIRSDLELTDYLLQEAGVAVIPGSIFAFPKYLRMSYAASRIDIERGMSLIQAALSKLRT